MDYGPVLRPRKNTKIFHWPTWNRERNYSIKCQTYGLLKQTILSLTRRQLILLTAIGSGNISGTNMAKILSIFCKSSTLKNGLMPQNPNYNQLTFKLPSIYMLNHTEDYKKYPNSIKNIFPGNLAEELTTWLKKLI